jgi:hypothetical protein
LLLAWDEREYCIKPFFEIISNLDQILLLAKSKR